jgi:hypothetical protein
MDPGASGPNERRGSPAASSRLRRRAPALQGSADRTAAGPPGPSVMESGVDGRRMRVAPRKAWPFVPRDGGLFCCAGRSRRPQVRREARCRSRTRSASARYAGSPRARTRCFSAPSVTPTSRRRSVRSCASTTTAPRTSSRASREGIDWGGTAFWGSGRAGSSPWTATAHASRRDRSRSRGGTPRFRSRTCAPPTRSTRFAGSCRDGAWSRSPACPGSSEGPWVPWRTTRSRPSSRRSRSRTATPSASRSRPSWNPTSSWSSTT